MFGGALRVWNETTSDSNLDRAKAALLQACDATTNLYHIDMDTNSPLAYRLEQVNSGFDLRWENSYLLGDYPDRRYTEDISVPGYVAANTESRPNYAKIRAKIEMPQLNKSGEIIFERLILPYLAADEKRQSLALSRALLIIDDISVPQSMVLSARERQCLLQLTKGQSAKRIANDLGIAQKTVEHCIERLKDKLGANNVAQAVANAMLTSSDAALASPAALTGAALSPRERQCLGLLASGRSWRRTAAELGISPKTVEKHVEALKLKLGARNATELVALGIATAMHDAA
jgi:DNA-binding CsgD family transcriptional regulator